MVEVDRRSFKRVTVIGLFAVAFCMMFAGENNHKVKAQQDTFIQNDWQGGASGDTASHPESQTGWNTYSSKEEKITTIEEGTVKLFPETYIITDSTDEDFNKGEMSKVVISGTGADAVIQVTPSVADPFASSLGEWLTLPAQPRPGRFTTFVNAGDVIYCLFASGDGRQFGRFDITSQKWVMLAPLPSPAAAGSSIAWDGEAVFALRGEGFVALRL